jgi:hypothetical protein
LSGIEAKAGCPSHRLSQLRRRRRRGACPESDRSNSAYPILARTLAARRTIFGTQSPRLNSEREAGGHRNRNRRGQACAGQPNTKATKPKKRRGIPVRATARKLRDANSLRMLNLSDHTTHRPSATSHLWPEAECFLISMRSLCAPRCRRHSSIASITGAMKTKLIINPHHMTKPSLVDPAP